MHILPIASSSEGNSSFIYTDEVNIVIDAGVPLKRVLPHITKLNAIFVSHEHSDHIKNAGVFGRKFKCPVYIHARTKNKTKHLEDTLKGCEIREVLPGTRVSIGDLEVFHFSTKHDVPSFGYLIKQKNGPTLCYLTDSGMLTKVMVNYAKKADALLIEADYDEQSLSNYEGYDDYLKGRISGLTGHLSNQQTIQFIETLGVDRFTNIIFAHLSPRTNSPELLKEQVLEKLGGLQKKMYIAPFDTPLEIIQR